MLNLAIVVLVVLVVGTLWLLLRPPAPDAGNADAPDAAPRTEDAKLAGPLGHPDVRVVPPPQSEERAPNH